MTQDNFVRSVIHMIENPLVTIILTTLNSEQFLVRSIESCLSQTYTNFEFLIVDGGSQDKTLDIVAGSTDPRIRVIHQEGNVDKLPGALNLGMSEAQGDFITWTQDDCWFEPHAIATMVTFLQQNPNVGLVYTDYWDIDAQGNRIRYWRVEPPEHILYGDIIRQTFLFRREVYETIGPQDPQYFPIHEVPWRLKLVKHFVIQPLHIPLMDYMVHSHSLTGQLGAWELQPITLKALREEEYVDDVVYQQRLSDIHIHWAYDHYILQGNFREFWKHALLGIRLNWKHVTNRGLLKLMVYSLSPVRHQFRSGLFERWQKADQRKQQQNLALVQELSN